MLRHKEMDQDIVIRLSRLLNHSEYEIVQILSNFKINKLKKSFLISMENKIMKIKK